MEGELDSPRKPHTRSASEDLWARTLSQIPSRLGQMAYLSRLRNPQSGQYEHHGLIAMFGEPEAVDALRRSHEEAFRSFLGLGLLDQVEDFRRFLFSIPQPAGRLLTLWERNKGYEALLPPETSEPERLLFAANLRLIMHHLQGETAAADSSPNH
jgi:hypothetical protein